jgi:hypothetical protein
MQSATGRRRITRLVFYIAVAALVVTVWRIERNMNVATFPPNTIMSSSPSDTPSSPSQWQQMGVQAVSETTRLLTTLATALLAALGLLLVNRDSDRPKPRHLWSAVLSAMGAGVSLFFGFVVHLYLVGMINSESFDAYRLRYPSYYQFYALLVGAFFLADFAFHDLSREN